MEASWGRLPRGLRPPREGNVTEITWRADIGPALTPGDIAACFDDLQTAMSVGERWGVRLARESARRTILNQISREGPRVLGGLARELGYDERDIDMLDEWMHGPWGPRRSWAVDPWGILDTVADTQATKELGSHAVVQRAEYRNPLEVILTGSGFLILGCAYTLRLIRDWSNTRRAGAGAAREAVAAARHAEARAELFQWLVDEARAGRMPVPPGALLNMVTQTEAEAVHRLATSDIALELPSGFETGRGSATE
ncbi:MAG: hypothetical protein ACRDZM_01895 [Acidimicrobiia bacterium]